MKFKNKLILLCSILGLLVAAYVLGALFSYGSASKIREIALFPGLKKESVSTVELSGPEGSMVLELEQTGSWMVKSGAVSYPADADKLDTLLTSISGLKQVRIVSRNAENLSNFDLTDSAARRIILKDREGRELADMFLGKETGKGDYVRLAKSETVLSSNKSLSFYTAQDMNYWTNLKIFPEDLQGSDIDSITMKADLVLEKDGAPVRADYTIYRTVVNKAEVWQLQGREDFKLDQNKADTMAKILANLRVRTFAGIKEDVPAGSAVHAEIRFSTGTKASYAITVGESSGEDQYYMMYDKSPYLYNVANWNLQALIMTIDELKAAPAQETGNE
ncbi:MAG: DUF4340 domain-containing protein [Spirochaetales bacterium]|nr:MAG: DUF4340 domain-containing protein [Spirochaetales bacterium]